MDSLCDVQLSDKEIQHLNSHIDSYALEITKQHQELVRTCRLQLDQLQQRISKLTDLALDDALDREVFRTKHRALLEEETALKEKLAALQRDDGTVADNLREFVERLKSPSCLYKTGSMEKKRELLKEMLSNLQVSGKNVDVASVISPKAANGYHLKTGQRN